jgi:hypothetical protein
MNDDFQYIAHDSPKEITTTIYEQYFHYLDRYKKQYGEKTVVFFENNLNFELYSINDDENDKQFNEVCKLLKLIIGQPKRMIPDVSIVNPLTIGFSCVYKHNMANTLSRNGYTVIIMEKYCDSSYKYQRKVTSIIKHELIDDIGIILGDNKDVSNFLSCSVL